jgi:ribosomal protein S18 acetylase RimI-like enzyme
VDDRVLDNPAYFALTGPQSALALRSGPAVRYPAAAAPFAALAPDPGPADWAALAAIADPVVALLDPGEIPAAWTVRDELTVTQMVLERPLAGPEAQAVEPLGPADVADMLELVDRTHPGPFGPDTITLGRYVGERDGGRLVAMAGERMRPPGWTEVSGVCTSPAHRGRNLARRVVADVVGGIQARGDHAFLHVLTKNLAAIGLYESMGFTRRRTLSVLVLAGPGPFARTGQDVAGVTASSSTG